MSSIQYNSKAQEGEAARTPILTTIYNVTGVLWIIAGGIALLITAGDARPFGIASAAVAIFLGMISFGIGQVVMLIARIEFNTRATDSSYQMVKLLREVARNTADTKPQVP